MTCLYPSGGVFGMLANEGLKNLGYLILMLTRQSNGHVKHFAQSLSGLWLRDFLRIFLEENLDRDAQDIGDGINLLGAESHGVTLPVGIGRLGNPELFGDMRLRKAVFQTGGIQLFAKGCAFLFGRPADRLFSFVFHGAIILPPRKK